MACVIRVKRRIDDDPAEALFLSCKRRRESDILDTKSVLSFAGTILSKDEPVSSHIKNAIRQKKIHKERQPHSANFKHSLHLPEITSKLRKETEQTSRANRYRITWSRRTLDLELLDKNDVDTGEKWGDSPDKSVSLSRIECGKDVINSCTADKKLSDSANKVDNISSPSSHSDDSSADISKDLSNENNKNDDSITSKTDKTSKNIATVDAKSPLKDDKMFCIFDVENDVDDDSQIGNDQRSASGITLNNVPMQSTRVTVPPSNEFVYDLYYTHNNLSDLDKEAVLTVEALCDELVCDQDIESSDRDLVYEDEDDSNDENNWRADYPDEDPRYYENAEEDYDYAEDMVDTNFLHVDGGGGGDDDGDLLAYWMGTRCKVDVASDDGEDEYEADDGDSSDSSDE